MIEDAEGDFGAGLVHQPRPLWSLKTINYRKQTFPPGREVIVEHSYAPSVGGSAQTFVGAEFATRETMAEYERLYCTNDAFVRAARRRQMTGRDHNLITEQRFSDILTTGSNWAGTIGDFRLVVDKGAPENLVSFCMEGIKKISPTEFEVRKQDFWPNRNLDP